MVNTGSTAEMSPVVKVPLKYGVLAGMIASGLLTALYYLDRHPFLIPVYLDFRIILFGIFIFFVLREIRDYHQDGILYFSQGIVASLLFTVCYATVTSLFIVGFTYLVPEFLASYISLQTELITSLSDQVIESIGRDVYQRNLELLPSTTAYQLAQTYFVQSFLISFFISIILSVTLRRQPKP